MEGFGFHFVMLFRFHFVSLLIVSVALLTRSFPRLRGKVGMGVFAAGTDPIPAFPLKGEGGVARRSSEYRIKSQTKIATN
jgi:hypothetical protein